MQAPSDGSAINVNLDSSEQEAYQYMVEHGASVYYEGTAQWNGTQSGGQMGFGICSSNPKQDYMDKAQTCALAGVKGTCPDAGIYDFSKLPQTMKFQFAFPTPTNYVNCVNYTASQLAGHDVRGVQTSTSETVVNQLTVHMDPSSGRASRRTRPCTGTRSPRQYIGEANPHRAARRLEGRPLFGPFPGQERQRHALALV